MIFYTVVGNVHGPQIGDYMFTQWAGMGIILGCAAGATGKWAE